MDFKAQIAQDLDVFLNSTEFADTHSFDGVSVTAMVDGDLSTERGIRQDFAEGTNIDDLVVFIKASDLPQVPTFGQRVNFDGTHYLVNKISESSGMLELTLRIFGA